jgi:hypothetical protein
MEKQKCNPGGILKTCWLFIMEDIYSRRKRIFRQQMGHKVKEQTRKLCILTRNLCGAENWTLRKVDQKYL